MNVNLSILHSCNLGLELNLSWFQLVRNFMVDESKVEAGYVLMITRHLMPDIGSASDENDLAFPNF